MLLSLSVFALAVCSHFASVAAWKNTSNPDVVFNTYAVQVAAPERDSRFGVRAEYFAGPIDRISAYVTTLQFLKREAKLDIHGFTPSSSIDAPSHGLRISAAAPDLGSFPRSLLVWGLYRSLERLSRDDRFTRVVFHLTFDNDEFAVIVFEPIQYSIKSNNTSHSPNNLSALPNEVDDDEDGDSESSPNPAENIRPYFVPRGRDLSMGGVFLPLAAGMVRIAQQGIMALAGDFVEKEFEEHTQLIVCQSPIIHPRPPPFLGIHCLKALWRTAVFVANMATFKEVIADVEIATVLYGTIAVRPLVTESGGNVATS